MIDLDDEREVKLMHMALKGCCNILMDDYDEDFESMSLDMRNDMIKNIEKLENMIGELERKYEWLV